MNRPALVVCEIHPASEAEGSLLAQIVATCARDAGQPVSVTSGAPPEAMPESSLTLHLPAEQAAAQHEVWCLACRLACFCPQARVSVLVHGAFSGPPALGEEAHSA